MIGVRKMMKLLNTERMGINEGTVCFIINFETDDSRFDSIPEGMARINVLISVPGTDDAEIFVVSKNTYEDGIIVHWREDISLTSDELKLIQDWCIDNHFASLSLQLYEEETDEAKMRLDSLKDIVCEKKTA